MDNATIPQSAYDFLFHFNRNYVVYLSPFSRYSRLFVKSRRFLPTTSAFGALVGGAVEFRGDLWRQKTRFPGLSCGVVFVILCLAVLVELRFVTDRQTQTQAHGQYHGCIASRGKKCNENVAESKRSDVDLFATDRRVSELFPQLREHVELLLLARLAYRYRRLSQHFTGTDMNSAHGLLMWLPGVVRNWS